MEKETIKRIFYFLENKENKKHKDKGTLRWKFIFNEPLTKDELIVNGDLNLANSKITYLPEGLEIKGSLDLRNCTSLTSLPEGLEIKGSLYLRNCTSLTSLPEGLKVEGFLDIKHTQLKNYTNDELRKMIYLGHIKGEIIR